MVEVAILSSEDKKKTDRKRLCIGSECAYISNFLTRGEPLPHAPPHSFTLMHACGTYCFPWLRSWIVFKLLLWAVVYSRFYMKIYITMHTVLVSSLNCQAHWNAESIKTNTIQHVCYSTYHLVDTLAIWRRDIMNAFKKDLCCIQSGVTGS